MNLPNSYSAFFFLILKAYPVHAFKEKSVVGNGHCSPQCSNEGTEVCDILGCRIKQEKKSKFGKETTNILQIVLMLEKSYFASNACTLFRLELWLQ